jgi:hypothetical protein
MMGNMSKRYESQHEELAKPGITLSSINNDSRCPTTDEWVKKMYIYTMKFYSSIKKNEIM